jgi:serine/threonine protein kinase
LLQKLSLLQQMSKGLAELHDAGIVHGDLKPDNVLLDSTNGMHIKIRFADFGLALLREKDSRLSMSTLRQTKNAKGTPIYLAPECMLNPYEPAGYGQSTVASISRRTDVYAFCMMTWEVFTQIKPFSGVKSDLELGIALHQDVRPPLDLLPSDTPPGLIGMIVYGWDGDRSKRPTAAQCSCHVQFHYQVLTAARCDIFFSHAWGQKPFLSHVYAHLVKCGYRVWYDQNDMGTDIQRSMVEGIAKSKVVLACVSSTYQTRPNCLFELSQAQLQSKSIVTLVLEEQPLQWSSDELKSYCHFDKLKYADISRVAQLPWDADEGATDEMMSQLKTSLSVLLSLLTEIECFPSFIKQ